MLRLSLSFIFLLVVTSCDYLLILTSSAIIYDNNKDKKTTTTTTTDPDPDPTEFSLTPTKLIFTMEDIANKVYIYDSTTKATRSISHTALPTLVAVESNVAYLIGGVIDLVSFEIVNKITKYNALTDSSTEIDITIPDGVIAASVINLNENGKVLLFSGKTLSIETTNKSQIFDANTESFTEVGNMQVARDSYTACSVKLSNGKIFIAGGENEDAEVVNSAEIFDPATNEWTLLDNTMNSTRTDHACVLMGNGKVLIVGGIDESDNVMDTAEIFDPNNNSFTAVASMPDEIHKHTLIWDSVNERVLLFGGSDSMSAARNTIRIYDPDSNVWSTHSETLNTARTRTYTFKFQNNTAFIIGTASTQEEVYNFTNESISTVTTPIPDNYGSTLQTATLL